MVNILEITNLSYKDFININLSFMANTYYSIIGPNNCGKTTLFKLITGIIPSNNIVCCNNIVLNRENVHDFIVNLGIVERVNKNSFIFNSVIDEMSYPLHNLGFSKRSSLKRINEVLELFDKSSLIDKSINDLTYYEKQLLLIMIAVLHQPKVLLLDSVLEIFPNRTREKIVKILKKLINDNMTVISFTNSLEEAMESDKIILLDKFEIIGEYTKEDIYNNDKLFYEHNLEIPFLTDLSIKLGMYDLVHKEYHSMKAMVDDIWP